MIKKIFSFFYAVAFFLAFFVGTLGAGAIAKWGGRLLLVDIPVKRSSHKKTTPKGGGIGIVLVALGYAVYNPLFSWIFPLVALALFSFYGDSKEISFKWRLFFQVVFIFFSLLLASIFIKPDDFYHLSCFLFSFVSQVPFNCKKMQCSFSVMG